MKCIVVARSNVRLGFRIGSRLVANFACIRLCGGIILIVVIVPSTVTLARKD